MKDGDGFEAGDRLGLNVPETPDTCKFEGHPKRVDSESDLLSTPNGSSASSKNPNEAKTTEVDSTPAATGTNPKSVPADECTSSTSSFDCVTIREENVKARKRRMARITTATENASKCSKKIATREASLENETADKPKTKSQNLNVVVNPKDVGSPRKAGDVVDQQPQVFTKPSVPKLEHLSRSQSTSDEDLAKTAVSKSKEKQKKSGESHEVKSLRVVKRSSTCIEEIR